MFFPRSLVPGTFHGVPQSQVISQVTSPRSFLGVSQSWPGRSTSGWATPWLGQDGVPCSQDRTGVPPASHIPPASTGWGTPLARSEWGGPLPPPLLRGQNSRATTCYAACSMPLAFTQEDFLVSVKVEMVNLLHTLHTVSNVKMNAFSTRIFEEVTLLLERP